MRYFITGATGFVGGEIARQLRAAGHDVIALVRSPQKAAVLADLGVQLAEGDITEKDSMRSPMQGVDGVFHTAGWYKLGVKDTSLMERINVEGTRHVLDLMRELGTPKGVYTSTVAVFSDTQGRVFDETYRFDGKHISAYDRTKWQAHYEVAVPAQQAGLPLVIVQPGLVYGPGDTSAMGRARIDYLKRRLPMVPSKTSFCWGHVEDTARGHLLAMERGAPGESYIIAGPRHTFIDSFEIAERITGIPAPPIHPPPWFVRLTAMMTGVVGAVIPLPEAYTAESLRVIAGSTYWASSAKAERELGWQARSLEEGFRQTLPIEMAQAGVRPRTAAAS
jgi:nucleoside-diphosphate-sugar epimerase